MGNNGWPPRKLQLTYIGWLVEPNLNTFTSSQASRMLNVGRDCHQLSDFPVLRQVHLKSEIV